VSRAFVCDRCKRPADVLYVQRGRLCGRCRYPEAYRRAALIAERVAPDSAYSQLVLLDAAQLRLPA
jgi:hypothetical protein